MQDLFERIVNQFEKTALHERVADRFEKAALMMPKLDMGGTVENGMVRVHRGAEYFRVYDLTNAGKRGKKVDIALIKPVFSRDDSPAVRNERWRMLSIGIEHYDTLRGVVGFFKDLNVDYPGAYEISMTSDRGVDVTPAGFKELKIKTDHLLVEVDYHGFRVQDLDDDDNQPTCIPASEGRQKEIPVFYRWVQDNEDSIRQMKYREVLAEMKKMGIPYHSYCAMD